ncbi:MAG: alpha amylase N-terminal ig-like domain-containing protein, partial [Lachnospiraceae bacterium]|nr:alpha amylase N-terminal ig-like domain-containing protein [Lachnospiraceae bacterium]
MEQWLESVYSAGKECFVSNPQPEIFETVTVWIRMYEDAPVNHVFLRTVPNGAERLIKAEKKKVKNGLAYYAAELEITESRMQYHFYLVCDKVIYYYNQKEITTHIPDHTYDFVLLAEYRQPSWVKNAVFYQIFPERFCNGNPDNDVKDGEYQY